MKTVGDWVCQVVQALKAVVPPEQLWREARLLVAAALKTSYENVFFHPSIVVDDASSTHLQSFMDRRQNFEPLSKIIGMREFWKLSFLVTADTLDPRPDSETLVEAVLAVYGVKPPLRALDLGTGTGCLIISLLSEYVDMSAMAVDISLKALDVAQKNALTHGVDARLELRHSHWFDQVTGTFDLIISNPPYIARDEILDTAVLKYDPDEALFADNHGLAAYEKIAEKTAGFLNKGGRIFVEIGLGQQQTVGQIFQAKHFVQTHVFYDIVGIARCLVFIYDENI